jgi:methylated-DNA-[protein]-cysteine S-methyltransferase
MTSIAWTALASSWGPVHLAASRSGLVELDLLADETAFLAALRRRFGSPIVALADAGPSAEAGIVRRASDLVAGYLDGRVATLDVPLDLRDRPAWDRTVLAAVAGIPRGETASYGEIARRIGRRGAARAVGGAVGRNPVGLVVPCHRVIAADGTLGGYGGDRWGSREARLDLKRRLLELERAWPPAAGSDPRRAVRVGRIEPGLGR